MQFILPDKSLLYNHSKVSRTMVGTKQLWTCARNPMETCFVHKTLFKSVSLSITQPVPCSSLSPTSYSFLCNRCHPSISTTPYYLLSTSDTARLLGRSMWSSVHTDEFRLHFGRLTHKPACDRCWGLPERKLIVVTLLAEMELFNNYFFISGREVQGVESGGK